MRPAGRCFRKACKVSSMSCGLSSTSRMSTGCSGIACGSVQGETECRACIRLCLGPNRTAMAMDDALDNREAHAGAFILVRSMEPLEDAEELVGIFHPKPDTVVPDV